MIPAMRRLARAPPRRRQPLRWASSSAAAPPAPPPLPPPPPPATAPKPAETMVDRLLRQRILAHGPVSVADFMQEVLTAPIGGYYTEAAASEGRDDDPDSPAAEGGEVGVFGSRGDFVTAPEISQLFGELLGLWCVALWQSAGSPRRVELVELGPGRGKMMSDILRTAKHFPAFSEGLSVSLIEASPPLVRSQAEALEVSQLREQDASTVTGTEEGGDAGEEDGWLATGETAAGVGVRWFRHLTTALPLASAEAVPSAEEGEEEPLLIVLANEYWDALPARQFQLTERGWCEVCVDVAEEGDGSPHHLKWVLSPHESPAAGAYVPFILEGERQRLAEQGGAGAEAGAGDRGDPSEVIDSAPVERGGRREAGGVAQARAASAELMERKLEVAKREGAIDEEQYERAKAMIKEHAAQAPLPPADGSDEDGDGSAAGDEVMDRMEVSPDGLALVQEITARLQRRRGAALIVDYGSDRTYTDSLQAVKGHSYHPVLAEPGSADVSTSVDFRSLRRAARALAVPEGAEGGGAQPVQVHGPITQGALLMGMGIEARLSQLVAAAGGEETELGRSAIAGASRLVDSRTPQSMGALFKAMVIAHADLPTPAPFAADVPAPDAAP